MKDLIFILDSDDSKERKAEMLKSLIIKNSKTTKELLKKSELTKEDSALLSDIVDESKKILTTNIINRVELPYVKQIQEILHNTENLKLFTLFSYEPTSAIEKEAGNYSVKLNDTIFTHQNKINGKFVTGTTDTRLGIIDDLVNTDKENILKIKKFGVNVDDDFLYSGNVEDEYTLSAQFKLNRFPSKVHTQVMDKNGNGSIYTKRLTSRRTDILSFNYNSEHAEKIEIGAMAPFALKNDLPIYDNKFSPYSICVSISSGVNKYSVYTDYKFELGEIQYLTLKIKKSPNFDQQYIDDFQLALDDHINSGSKMDTFLYADRYWSAGQAGMEIKGLLNTLGNGFGDRSKYIITLSINGVQESIGRYNGKCWSTEKSVEGRKRNMIASGPGFMPRIYREETKYKLVVINSDNINWNDFLSTIASNFMKPTIKMDNNIKLPAEVTITSEITKNEIDACNAFFSGYSGSTGYSISYRLEPYLKQSPKPIRNSAEQTVIFKVLSLNNLKSITSSPGNLAFPVVIKDFDRYDRIYNRYSHKMNNGIEIGSIKIQSYSRKSGGEE